MNISMNPFTENQAISTSQGKIKLATYNYVDYRRYNSQNSFEKV